MAILAAAALLPTLQRLQPSNPLKWHKMKFAIAEIAANFANGILAPCIYSVSVESEEFAEFSESRG